MPSLEPKIFSRLRSPPITFRCFVESCHSPLAWAPVRVQKGDNGLATWINESEHIVGSADFPGGQIHHAALWYHGVITDLGTVGTDPCSRAVAINAKGQIVGRSTSCQVFLSAFIWENGGPMADLNTLLATGSDLTLTEALFINDAGEIAGSGVLPNGDAHAFVLIPCDDDHHDVVGCDYSMVDVAEASNAAALQTPRVTPLAQVSGLSPLLVEEEQKTSSLVRR